MTGRGTSGSWQMRGVQLGSAIGADLIPNCSEVKTFRQYDIVVVVKRINEDCLRALRTSGVYVVWDVVDAWPQFGGRCTWDRIDCLGWMSREYSRIRPNAIVAATHAMQRDFHEMIAGVYDTSLITLPHHGRVTNPFEVRDRVRTVGYEGAEHYIGRWQKPVLEWCARHGAKFVMNGMFHAYDIVLAVRDDFDYAATNWKSNVKLANAQMMGVPVICGQEMGYRETASGAERWVQPEDWTSITQCLDSLIDPIERERVSDQLLSVRRAVSLDYLAEQYRSWLWSLK
jgi:hypothetical protein